MDGCEMRSEWMDGCEVRSEWMGGGGGGRDLSG